MDWNDQGELFFINTVIGHLWHAVPGAHFQRMYGEDYNPHLYELIGQTADHFHWDTAEHWSDIRKIGVSPTTDQAGGGHAHAGLLIYQGDNWPDRYRDTVFTINLHGRRLNNDTLERRGTGYVGRHAPDFLKSSDPWFRGLDLISGADGGVYIADWCDIGECHGTTASIAIRAASSKSSTASRRGPRSPTSPRLSDAELVGLQRDNNDWYVRQSRQHPAAEGGGRPARWPTSTPICESSSRRSRSGPQAPRTLVPVRHRWSTRAWLLSSSTTRTNSVRAWAVRLLGDGKTPGRGLSARLPPWPPANDRARPLVPGLGAARVAAGRPLAAGGSTGRPWRLRHRPRPALDDLVRHRAGRSGEPCARRGVGRVEPDVAAGPLHRPAIDRESEARAAAGRATGRASPASRITPSGRHAILAGMAEALRGWRKAPVPASWKSAQETGFEPSPEPEVRRLVRELSVVFGDGRALTELLGIAAGKGADPPARRDAMRVLVEARAAETVPLLCGLLDDRDLGADAARGLAAFDDPQIAAASAAPKFAASNRPRRRRDRHAELAARLGPLAVGRRPSGKNWPRPGPRLPDPPDAGFPRRRHPPPSSRLWPELKTIPAAKRSASTS